MTTSPTLVTVQQLPTSCARCVQPFRLQGRTHLAIAQFARNLEGQAPGMHAGASDTPVRLYRWERGAFVEAGELPAAGGEDAEYFEIDGRPFLAIANIRSGSGPYEYDLMSVIYEWRDGRWSEFQALPSFGAKQWRHLRLGDEHFLALAQGIETPGLTARHPSTSRLYRWSGQAFVEHQVLDGRWGYNWTAVRHGGRQFLAYADHLAQSPLLEWRDGRLQPWLQMPYSGGRAFVFFEEDGELLGVFASISAGTFLGRFSDAGFEPLQQLGGPGGRELALLEHGGERYLARIDFITGSREAPRTALTSQLFVWRGGRFAAVADIPTLGGTSAAWFVEDGEAYLAVANSLDAEVRFATPCQVYRLAS